MEPKRLVLFVEGPGDVNAAPVLISKLVTHQNGWDAAFVDPDPFRMGDLARLSGTRSSEWVKKLRAAALRGNLGGVILLLDGDSNQFEKGPFCASSVAAILAERAREAGGGSIFSVSVVFACCEYESWLLSGIHSVAGRRFPLGDNGVKPGATAPEGDLEKAPRDAKGALSRCLHSGYSPPIHQRPLTEMVDWDAIRTANPRSFRRLESALCQMLEAFRSGRPIVSPAQHRG